MDSSTPEIPPTRLEKGEAVIADMENEKSPSSSTVQLEKAIEPSEVERKTHMKENGNGNSEFYTSPETLQLQHKPEKRKKNRLGRKALIPEVTPTPTVPTVPETPPPTETTVVPSQPSITVSSPTSGKRLSLQSFKMMRAKRWGADEIVPGVFVGDMKAAADLNEMKARGITHIVTTIGIPPCFPEDFKYLVLNCYDARNYDMISHFPKTNKFINDAVLEGGKVLVHCQMGKSRSPTVVMAYMLAHCGFDYEKMTDFVLSKRSVQPNYGFLEQLQLYESMGCNIEGSSDSHKKYQELRVTSMLIEFGDVRLENGGKITTPYPGDMLAAEYSDSSWYGCSGCQRIIVHEACILQHKPVEGTCKHWFVQAYSWMGPLSEPTGELQCPDCFLKLGHYSWKFAACDCSFKFEPAFLLEISSVKSKEEVEKLRKEQEELRVLEEQRLKEEQDLKEAQALKEADAVAEAQAFNDSEAKAREAQALQDALEAHATKEAQEAKQLQEKLEILAAREASEEDKNKNSSKLTKCTKANKLDSYASRLKQPTIKVVRDAAWEAMRSPVPSSSLPAATTPERPLTPSPSTVKQEETVIPSNPVVVVAPAPPVVPVPVKQAPKVTKLPDKPFVEPQPRRKLSITVKVDEPTTEQAAAATDVPTDSEAHVRLLIRKPSSSNIRTTPIVPTTAPPKVNTIPLTKPRSASIGGPSASPKSKSASLTLEEPKRERRLSITSLISKKVTTKSAVNSPKVNAATAEATVIPAVPTSQPSFVNSIPNLKTAPMATQSAATQANSKAIKAPSLSTRIKS